MAESISIVMKMTDDISGTMRSIASSSVSVSKQFEEMQRKAQQLGSRYDALNKKAAATSAETMRGGGYSAAESPLCNGSAG